MRISFVRLHNKCINNGVKLDAYHPIPIPIAHSCAIAYCLVRPSGAESPIATHPFHAIPSPLPLLESRRRGQSLLSHILLFHFFGKSLWPPESGAFPAGAGKLGAGLGNKLTGGVARWGGRRCGEERVPFDSRSLLPQISVAWSWVFCSFWIGCRKTPRRSTRPKEHTQARRGGGHARARR